MLTSGLGRVSEAGADYGSSPFRIGGMLASRDCAPKEVAVSELSSRLDVIARAYVALEDICGVMKASHLPLNLPFDRSTRGAEELSLRVLTLLGVVPDDWTYAMLLRFEHRFGVSAQAFGLRLLELGLIAAPRQAELRKRIGVCCQSVLLVDSTMSVVWIAGYGKVPEH
jgi:hypothetical protein